LARAEELNFNALIKPSIVEGIQGDGIKEGNKSNKDIPTDNISDILIDSNQDIKIDNKLDIPLANNQISKISKKKPRKQTSKNSQPEFESPLAALIASKKGKRKEDKVFVGLHLPRDVDEVLTQFKKDTDIDRSEAVASFVRILLKDYFE